jgi:hypothetical protein
MMEEMFLVVAVVAVVVRVFMYRCRTRLLTLILE